MIDGALVLGFTIPTVVSISAIDVVAMMMLPAIILFAYATFGQKQIEWRALPATLLTATVFSLAFAFAGTATNPLYAMLCWLPIVLMYLLRLLDHPLVGRIRRGLAVSCLFLFFLGLGIVFRMYFASPVPYLLFLAMFLGLTLIWFFKAT